MMVCMTHTKTLELSKKLKLVELLEQSFVLNKK